MQVQFKETTLEKVVKGRTSYTIAHVKYDFNGQERTQRVLSFANPEVFKIVQDLKSGENIDVTITKNDAGYDQWAAVKRVGAESPRTATPTQAPKATVSNYETREERLERQLHIVRQSCLGYAVNTLSAGAKTPPKREDVTELAQHYVDFVYGNEFVEEVGKTDGDFEDVSH